MESSIRDDKIEEEGKSMKHAAAAAGAQVNAGSDNSSTIVVLGKRGKRKEEEMMMMQPPSSPIEPSPKRICVIPPEEDSSDEPLPGDADDLDHTPPPQSQKAGLRNQVDQIDGDVGSDADSDAEDADSDAEHVPERYREIPPESFDDMIKERKPTREELNKFAKDLEVSQGFDVDFCYRIHIFASSVIKPMYSYSIMLNSEDFKHFMELAAAEACKGLGGQVLEDLQIVKATQLVLPHCRHYYLTFIAQGSLDGVVRCYQAKATCTFNYDSEDTEEENKVEFVWLKAERGEVTAEDRKQLEGCDEDSIRQFYMDAFCAIEPLSQDEIYFRHEEYKRYMQLAVDKARMDLGGQKLKGLRVVEAYNQLFGVTMHHYFTFNAKGCLDGELRIYRAKVISTWIESEVKYTVEFVRLQDEVTAEEWVDERIKHRKLAEARKVFLCERTNMNIDGVVMSVDAEKIKGEDYNRFMKLAAAEACKVLGGQQLEELQIVEANKQCFGTTTTHHYITFTAKGSSDGKCRRYRAKVTSTHSERECKCETEYCECEYESDSDSEAELKLKLKESAEYVLLEDEDGEFVRLEDGHYQAPVNASQSSNSDSQSSHSTDSESTRKDTAQFVRLEDDHGL